MNTPAVRGQTIIGHTAQRNFLMQMLTANRVPPAMIFTGMSGIGKRLVALELIRTLFCDQALSLRAGLVQDNDQQTTLYGGCSSCKGCRLFDSRNMPDFYEVDCREREQSNVESIRELLYSLHLTSHQSGARVALLDNAEYLNVQGANALLKSLEEPSSDTYYMLVCANPYRLPATLLSRCQVTFFDSLTTPQIAEAVLHSEIWKKRDEAEGLNIDELCILADGSLENIEQLMAHSRSWREIQNTLLGIATGDFALAIAFASELAKAKSELRVQLRLMQSFARHQMHECTSSASSSSELRAAWSHFLINIMSAERLLFERNLAPAALLSVIFTRLADGARGLSFTGITNGDTLSEAELFG